MKLERLLHPDAAARAAQHRLHYHLCCLPCLSSLLGPIWIGGKCELRAGGLAYSGAPSVRRETEVEIFQWL